MAYTTIDDPSAHFQVNSYSGASNPQTITNGGNSDLQPDFLWSKRKDSSAPHYLFDSTRGVNSSLSSDDADAEDTATGYLASFNSDGFTTGSDSALAYSGRTYVAWQWKANGGTTTSFSESGNNPAGTHQANTTAGFSIVTHVGTGSVGTIAHGLSAAPEWILTKGLDDGHAWITAHKSVGFDKNTLFNTTDAFASDSTYNDTDPTSSVFTVKNQGGVNKDGENYVNYLFHSVQGYSKIGSYTGNGNADGPFMYTGFKPALVIIKGTTGSKNWFMYDTTRNPFNLVVNRLIANGSEAENTGSGDDIDILSNGWKIRANPAALNENGEPFIYIAFAESPFVSSEGVPTTAR